MFEAYAVAVRVSLINQVSAGLIGMAGEFRRADIAASIFQRRLDGIKKTMLVGGLQIAAGVGILAAFKPALEQAKLFQNELTRFSLYGMGDQANREAAKFAKSMNVAGSSYVDNMRLMTEAQGIFRESGKRTLAEQLQGAQIAAPILAKLSFIERGLSDDQRSLAHAQDLAMLRFIEARGGANDPRTFASIADWGYKLQQSSGGVVDWSALQQLTATSGAAGYNLSQDAISALEPVIADMKGGRTGSGLRVAFQRLLGTQRGLPKQAVSEFLSLGLWDPSRVQLNGQGGINRFTGDPGSVLRQRTLFATDPVGFYKDVFLPAIAKKYGSKILGDTPEARVERAAEISMVFGPGTASAVFSQIDKLMPAIARSQAAQNRQLGIDQAYNATKNTLSGQQVALAAQFKDVLEATGEVVLPIVVRGLQTLLPVLQSISAFATAHPRLFGFVIDSLMLLGAALVVSGVVTGLTGLASLIRLVGGVAASTSFINVAAFAERLPLIGASLSRLLMPLIDAGGPIAAILSLPLDTILLIGAAIVGLGVAVYEAWKHWDSHKTVFQNLRDELGGFMDWLYAKSQAMPPWMRNAAMATPLAPTIVEADAWHEFKYSVSQFFEGVSTTFSQHWTSMTTAINKALAPVWSALDGAKKAGGGFLDWLGGWIARFENLIPAWMRGGGPKTPPAVGAAAAAGAKGPGLFEIASRVWNNPKFLGSFVTDAFFGDKKGQNQLIAQLFPELAKLGKANGDLAVSHAKLAKSEGDAAKVFQAAIDKLEQQLAGLKLSLGSMSINLDGQKVGKIVSNQQAQGSTGPNSLSHGFDHSAALAGASAGYRR